MRDNLLFSLKNDSYTSNLPKMFAKKRSVSLEQKVTFMVASGYIQPFDEQGRT